MKNFLESLFPDQTADILLLIGGCIGASAQFIWGDLSDAFGWLVIAVLLDYITGTIAAFKSGDWSSKVGFNGLLRKAVIFVLVGLANGTDTLLGSFDFFSLRDIAIGAFGLNEIGSIIENIELLGFGKVIPEPIKKGLAMLKKKAIDEFKIDDDKDGEEKEQEKIEGEKKDDSEH